MTEHSRRIKKLDRKYRRMKQQNSWEVRRQKLPLLLGYAAVILVAVLIVWFLTKPRTAPIENGAMRVYMLDIGQGDAMLIQTNSHDVLIDAGDCDQGTKVVQMLKAAGVKHLDAVINSHPHADHLGGISAVLAAFPVDMLYLPAFPDALMPTGYSFSQMLDTAADHKIAVRSPECHEKLKLGSAELEFLCADNSEYDDLNDCSLGCRIVCGEISIFSAGDLAKNGEAAFLEHDLVQPATVYKVSHHGSGNSSSAAFLAALQPQYAMVSCGAMNDYGHPAQKTLARLRETGCEIYRTDIDGTIVCETDGRNVQFQTGFDFGFSGKITLKK